MRIALSSDHAGVEYRLAIKAHLELRNHQVVDLGPLTNEPIDYPDVIRPAAQQVASGACDVGVILGGSGNGEAIVANKVPGIRCAVCWNEYTAGMAKKHNNANIISLGQRTIDLPLALKIVDTWLDATFEGGRHQVRIDKIG